MNSPCRKTLAAPNWTRGYGVSSVFFGRGAALVVQQEFCAGFGFFGSALGDGFFEFLVKRVFERIRFLQAGEMESQVSGVLVHAGSGGVENHHHDRLGRNRTRRTLLRRSVCPNPRRTARGQRQYRCHQCPELFPHKFNRRGVQFVPQRHVGIEQVPVLMMPNCGSKVPNRIDHPFRRQQARHFADDRSRASQLLP